MKFSSFTVLKSGAMRIVSLCVCGLLYSQSLFAQYSNPHVSWSFSSKKITDDQFDLLFTASIQEGFHLYSQFIGEGGPIPTSFTFDKSDSYKFFGKVKESGNKKEE